MNINYKVIMNPDGIITSLNAKNILGLSDEWAIAEAISRRNKISVRAVVVEGYQGSNKTNPVYRASFSTTVGTSTVPAGSVWFTILKYEGEK